MKFLGGWALGRAEPFLNKQFANKTSKTYLALVRQFIFKYQPPQRCGFGVGKGITDVAPV